MTKAEQARQNPGGPGLCEAGKQPVQAGRGLEAIPLVVGVGVKTMRPASTRSSTARACVVLARKSCRHSASRFSTTSGASRGTGRRSAKSWQWSPAAQPRRQMIAPAAGTPFTNSPDGSGHHPLATDERHGCGR